MMNWLFSWKKPTVEAEVLSDPTAEIDTNVITFRGERRGWIVRAPGAWILTLDGERPTGWRTGAAAISHAQKQFEAELITERHRVRSENP